MIQPDDVPWKVMMGKGIWALRGNPEQFRQAVKEMLQRCYPGFKPLRTEYPFLLCRCDWEERKRLLQIEAARWEKE